MCEVVSFCRFGRSVWKEREKEIVSDTFLRTLCVFLEWNWERDFAGRMHAFDFTHTHTIRRIPSAIFSPIAFNLTPSELISKRYVVFFGVVICQTRRLIALNIFHCMSHPVPFHCHGVLLKDILSKMRAHTASAHTRSSQKKNKFMQISLLRIGPRRRRRRAWQHKWWGKNDNFLIMIIVMKEKT